MDRRTRTRQELRRERQEAGLWFCAIAGMLLLGLIFWDALLAALGASALHSKQETSAPEPTAYLVLPEALPLSAVQTEAEEPETDPEEAEQLAIVIYREAGGDAVCDECRRRVADVALNRVADSRFPDTLFEVLTQKRQYGAMYWEGVTWPERAGQPGEQAAVERARETARSVLAGEHSALYGQGYIFQSEFDDLGAAEDRVVCCGIHFAKG